MGDNSCLRGRGFESWRGILDGHFFTLICCKNYIVCLKIPKINEKEAGVGPFLKKRTYDGGLILSGEGPMSIGDPITVTSLGVG